jgi:hypothetical protein
MPVIKKPRTAAKQVTFVPDLIIALQGLYWLNGTIFWFTRRGGKFVSLPVNLSGPKEIGHSFI